MGWLKKFCMQLWCPENDTLCNPTYIVPHSYGPLSAVKLSDAGVKAVAEASQIATQFPNAKIIFASTSYFWHDCEKHEERLKRRQLESLGVQEKRIVSAGALTNTVTEILAIRAVISKVRTANSCEVAVVTDWTHARSARAIWQELLPGARIKIHSVTGCWEKNHPAILQRTWRRAVFVNIVRHVMFLLVGQRIGRFSQITGRV